MNDEKDAPIDGAPAITPGATPQAREPEEVASQPAEDPFERTLIIAPGVLAEHLARAPREGAEVATTDLAARAPRARNASAGDSDARARPRRANVPGPAPPAGSERGGRPRAVTTVIAGVAICLTIALAVWVVLVLP